MFPVALATLKLDVFCSIKFTAITHHLVSVTMGSSNRTLILATIFLYLLLHFPSEAGARGLKSPAKCPKLLSQVCKTSQNYAFCVRVLMSNPLTLLAPSTKGIVVNALDIVRKESMKTSKFFDGLANGKGTVPAFKPALKECASDFKKASGLMNLKVLEGDFATMDVNYALDDARSCETKLSMDEVNIKSIPAAIKNWKNFYAVANAAALTLENLQN